MKPKIRNRAKKRDHADPGIVSCIVNGSMSETKTHPAFNMEPKKGLFSYNLLTGFHVEFPESRGTLFKHMARFAFFSPVEHWIPTGPEAFKE